MEEFLPPAVLSALRPLHFDIAIAVCFAYVLSLVAAAAAAVAVFALPMLFAVLVEITESRADSKAEQE